MIFAYNGKDGVVTEPNGLIYMRARYYSPELRRFINADIVHGEISDSTSLNRYAYVNGNPISFTDPFGLASWWKNVVKVAVGVVAITALAVVSVTTAGTATAVIAGAAAVGGAVGGTVGAVTGYVENGVDGAANGFLVGTASGTLSGTIAASPLNGFGVAAGNMLVDVGEYAVDSIFNSEDVTATGFFVAAGTSLFFDGVNIKLKKGVRVNLGFDSGWLNKAGDLYRDQQLLEHIIEKEARRANREYAEKKVLQSTARFNDILFDRLWEYGIDASKDEIKDLINDVVFSRISKEFIEIERK